MALLCLDVGNTQIHAGVFEQKQLICQFRYPTTPAPTSDQFGVFLKQVLMHHEISPSMITDISICSVVPALDYSLRSALIKYFDCEPFVLQPGVKTGLKIQYRNPVEVGADRIANAIAGIHHYPSRNLLIFDFGTATTCCVVSKDKEYLGGVIMPGMRLSMHALQQSTAKLNAVEIMKPTAMIGRSTTESIQSGLYYSQMAAIKMLSEQITQQVFSDSPPLKLATGGFAHLFSELELFDEIQSDLVLQGLRLSLEQNRHAICVK